MHWMDVTMAECSAVQKSLTNKRIEQRGHWLHESKTQSLQKVYYNKWPDSEITSFFYSNETCN